MHSAVYESEVVALGDLWGQMQEIERERRKEKELAPMARAVGREGEEGK